ncbi:hypothetical protein JVY00_06660 [Tsukamurella tyrosinosolvens]|uniref:hypothetical protein n=1 Tax=Tsukamurella tyrosinosolvens TaxID=57704 RepID=UPI001AF5CA82|nr:hypothetical protein [Tsukamurella tyrosinosolvens]QRY85747.1 hypothetical protein JVY00_06660 [Tsukamurella tyrosinosolvens]
MSAPAVAPVDDTAELYLIGAALWTRRLDLLPVLGVVLPADFADPRARVAWEFITHVAVEQGATPDPQLVVNAARHVGRSGTDHALGRFHEYVFAAYEVPNRQGLDYYAHAVREASFRRNAARLGTELQQHATSASMDLLIDFLRDRTSDLADQYQRVTWLRAPRREEPPQ